MSDLVLGETSTASLGTELQAEAVPDHDFIGEYIFQAAPYAGELNDHISTRSFDAIRGIANGSGTGVLGKGHIGVEGDGRRQNGIGVVGRGANVGVSGLGDLVGVIGRVSGSDARLPPPLDRAGVLGSSFGNRASAGVIGENNVGYGVFGTTDTGIGVYGESEYVGVRGGGDTGVHGLGGARGVHGSADEGIGVDGTSITDVGVRGVSTMNDGVVGRTNAFGHNGVAGFNNSGTGVFGFSIEATGVNGTTTSGIGVEGSSTSNVGVQGASKMNDGVHGTTTALGKSGVFGQNDGSLPRNAGGAAVFGVTGRADATVGFGVAGESANGSGVLGNGGTYGGVFQGERAPLRLVPSTTDTDRPPNSGFHQLGEVFVSSQGGLFFCTVSGRPGTWKRVQLVDVSPSLPPNNGTAPDKIIGANLLLWLRGDSLSGPSGTKVSLWPDKTSSHSDFSQPDTSKQPVLFRDPQKPLRPFLHFDGNWWLSANKRIAPSRTIMAMVRSASATGPAPLVQGPNPPYTITGDQTFSQFSSWGVSGAGKQAYVASVGLQNKATLFEGDQVVSDQSFHTLAVTHDHGTQLTINTQSLMLYKDGMSDMAVPRTADLRHAIGVSCIGGGRAASVSDESLAFQRAGDLFVGDIAEVLIYDGVLDSTQINQLHNYMTTFWI